MKEFLKSNFFFGLKEKYSALNMISTAVVSYQSSE